MFMKGKYILQCSLLAFAVLLLGCGSSQIKDKPVPVPAADEKAVSEVVDKTASDVSEVVETPADFVNQTIPAKAPILTGYRLGSGDSIHIEVFGEAELTLDVLLNDSGTFNYPYLGQLQVLNKTLDEVQAIITEGLDGDFLVNPKVSVTVDTYREIYVGGEVANGGNFAFQPGLSVGKAIVLAGGFTERASRSRIQVISEGSTDSKPKRVNLDYILKPGDVVTVPRRFF